MKQQLKTFPEEFNIDIQINGGDNKHCKSSETNFSFAFNQSAISSAPSSPISLTFILAQII